MAEQKDFPSIPDRSLEHSPLSQQETEKKIEIAEGSVSQESLDIVEQATPVLRSPEGEATAVVEEILDQFDHAEAINDKKKEAVNLERLLAESEEEILDVADEVQDDAIKYGEIKGVE